MKPASCPTHGREYLTNAGAPNRVRCTPAGSCATGVMEPHEACKGEGCEGCGQTGWRTRTGSWGSPYPVS